MAGQGEWLEKSFENVAHKVFSSPPPPPVLLIFKVLNGYLSDREKIDAKENSSNYT